jgi:hypothetical protein
MGDFEDVMTHIPAAGPAWAQVQAQLTVEGADDNAIGQAKMAFGKELSGLATGFGARIEQAVPAAAQYVQAGFTTIGAATHVAGLVSAAESGTAPAELVQMSTGVLVGLMVATGAATAGVGAAIVGVVSMIAGILESAGLFGSSKGVTVAGCPGMKFDPPPDQMIGCIPRYGPPISGAMMNTSKGPIPNPQWVHFPDPSDIAWFQVGSLSGKRKIDIGFPSYRYLECDAVNPWYNGKPQGIVDFRKAYLAAWKINQERPLNGQKPSTDSEVLYHVVTAWNRAHPSAGAADWVVAPTDAPFVDSTPLSGPITPFNLPVAGQKVALPPCPANLPPFVATLIRDLIGKGLTDQLSGDGSGLLVHMGPIKQPRVAATTLILHLGAVAPKKINFALGRSKPTTIGPVGPITAAGPHAASAVMPPAAPLSFWARALPFTPAAAGVVLFPAFGVLAPIVGGAISALWLQLHKS